MTSTNDYLFSKEAISALKNMRELLPSLSLSPTPDMQKMVASLSQQALNASKLPDIPISTFTSQIKSLYDSISKMPEINQRLYLSGIYDVMNDTHFMTSIFDSIVVNDNYVLVPEILIPDNYNYTETHSDTTHKSEEILSNSINVKKLSIPDAIELLYKFIALFLTIIALFQSHQSSVQIQKNHDELINFVQQWIEVDEEKLESFLEIINSLQESEKVSP